MASTDTQRRSEISACCNFKQSFQLQQGVHWSSEALFARFLCENFCIMLSALCIVVVLPVKAPKSSTTVNRSTQLQMEIINTNRTDVVHTAPSQPPARHFLHRELCAWAAFCSGCAVCWSVFDCLHCIDRSIGCFALQFQYSQANLEMAI
jgi:hypothetical protein